MIFVSIIIPLLLLANYNVCSTETDKLCDPSELVRNQIPCKKPMPCWFMEPIFSDKLQDSRQSPNEMPKHCECIEGLCVLPTLDYVSKAVSHVPCRPESCMKPKHPVVECKTHESCSFAYPYIPAEFANDWWSDLACLCTGRICEAAVTVGVKDGQNATVMIPCRGIQLEL